jgi:hypothetical protein
MLLKANRRSYYRRVFRVVLRRYHGLKEMVGTAACPPFYSGGGLDGSMTFNPRKVVVLPVDFLCDVELAAKRVLDRADYEFFRRVYIEGDEEFRQLQQKNIFTYRKRRSRIQERTGCALHARKIYPIQKYLAPVFP